MTQAILSGATHETTWLCTAAHETTLQHHSVQQLFQAYDLNHAHQDTREMSFIGVESWCLSKRSICSAVQCCTVTVSQARRVRCHPGGLFCHHHPTLGPPPPTLLPPIYPPGVGRHSGVAISYISFLED